MPKKSMIERTYEKVLVDGVQLYPIADSVSYTTSKPETKVRSLGNGITTRGIDYTTEMSTVKFNLPNTSENFDFIDSFKIGDKVVELQLVDTGVTLKDMALINKVEITYQAESSIELEFQGS